jgi:dTDP-L-rhamnose 4-epimerase
MGRGENPNKNMRRTMSKKKVLVTGGAGFIGTHLTNALLQKGWEVTILDALIRQVHPAQKWAGPAGARFLHGNVCHRNVVRESLKGVDHIVHLAAETGVGQSAYEIARYVKTNEYGTAVLLDEVTKELGNIKRIVLASSRAVYGEGTYECVGCGIVSPGLRNSATLKEGKWEPVCPVCRGTILYQPAVEGQSVDPVSIYGISKYNQEQLLKQFALTFNVPGITLRFQNVYGPGQALGNPYTGILAVFSTRFLANKPISIYEDGAEKRDFVFIDDVVQSITLALENSILFNYETYNIGTGKGTSILEIAHCLADEIGGTTPINLTGQYRVGDIRHAWADITKARKDFGYQPRFSLEEGLKRFVKWVNEQPMPIDRFQKTERELKNKGLLFKGKG